MLLVGNIVGTQSPIEATLPDLTSMSAALRLLTWHESSAQHVQVGLMRNYLPVIESHKVRWTFPLEKTSLRKACVQVERLQTSSVEQE